MSEALAPVKAPFPYFGGKSKVAPAVWERIGLVKNLVIPFCGSAAELLSCPTAIPTVTLNDLDGFLVNFYRAVQSDPIAVAAWLDWPVTEIDLFARHVWLVKQKDDLARRLQVDPEWYDAKIAGWWCWGACGWIGTGWCSGDGPWSVEGDQIVNIRGNAGQGVHRQLPHVGDAGQGVRRQLPHVGNAGQGVHRQLPHVGDAGQGVHRKLPNVSGLTGAPQYRTRHLESYMQTIADRLRTARITCGDWRRVLTPSVTTRHGLTAVLLDPPYGDGAMEYTAGGNDSDQIARDVWAWACAHGDDPLLRIAVYGYQDGRALPDGWTAMPWKARKGYQTSTANPHRETVWFNRSFLNP